MQTNPVAFQDAVARAREIAQKLSASAPNIGMNTSLKRSMNDDDYSHKRPAFGSPTHSSDLQPPALRAQKIAQQINMQLGAKGMPNDSSLPLSNQLTCQEDYKIPDKLVSSLANAVNKSFEFKPKVVAKFKFVKYDQSLFQAD
jgi:hypothetical protein